MQFRLVSDPATGLSAVCTVEGCGDTALRIARYQEWELGREQTAGPTSPAPPGLPASAPPSLPAPAPPRFPPPVPPAAPAPDNLQPPIQVHAPGAAYASKPAHEHAQLPSQPQVGSPSAPVPVFSPVFSREASAGPSIRDLIEHSPGFKDSQAAPGHSQADFERIWPDETPYELPLGAVAGSLPVDVRGRPATFGLPEGWRAWSAPELGRLPVSGDRRHHVVLEHPDPGKDRLFRLGVMTLPLVNSHFDLLAAVLECERQYALPVAARAVALNFAGSTGYLWHLQGRVAGRVLGKQDELVPMHLSEMQAPVGPYVVQLTVIAPVEKGRDAVAAAHTVIASWRWLA